ncbi:MAG TPA: ABC transporter permease [Minicystis sp.]|nr:ABC transporter permease [Minicystis sp.]
MRLAHELESIWALMWRDLVRFSRDRNQVLGAIARPLLWLLLMGKGLRAALPQVDGLDYQAFVFAGALAMTTLFSGTFQGVTIIWDREFGFLKEVLVAPIARTTIVLGKVLSGASVTFFTGIATIVFAPLVHVHLSVGSVAALAGVLALWSIAVTALGVVIATRMETFEGFGVISNFVILPLYFLSGGVFPVEHLPGWMAVLVRVNPTTYAVDLMRHALGQPAAFPLALGVLVLAGFTAAMVVLSLALFKRG